MGPLSGIKVIELAGIGPCPFAAMILSDLGAEVVRVERAKSVSKGDKSAPHKDLMNRGRKSIGVDLKNPEGVKTVLRLVKDADVLLEGFRPGVMERLGLGPDVCLEANPKLVFGRMTGWGQDGPMAPRAGHDINYIALAGALEAIGRKGEPPVPPINFVGDFGGGGMLLVMGVLAAIVERHKSGKGQVVDAAMVDGTALLTIILFAFRNMGMWGNERGSNVLDTGAHFYETYETKDGNYVALGSLEPQFYAELLQRIGMGDEKLPFQLDYQHWPAMKERFRELFLTKTRDEWCEIMEGSDACFAPVLSVTEAPEHPHMAARKTYEEVEGVVQPAPAPRFSRTPGAIQGPPPQPGAHTDETLKAWGFSDEELASLRESKAIA